MIDAWRPIGRLPDLDTPGLDALAAELDAHLTVHRPQPGQRTTRSRDVWHYTIRDHPDRPPLRDEQWAAVARRVLAATGIAPDGDPDACRWLALRTDSHEIRIVAPLMRADGTTPALHRDLSLAHAACQLAALETKPHRVRAVRAGLRPPAPPPVRGPDRPWAAPAAGSPPARH